VRFDGFTFTPVQSTFPSLFPNAPILGLTTDASGELLVRVEGGGVLRYRKGKFESVSSKAGTGAAHVTAMWRRSNGELLIYDVILGTLRLRQGRLEVLARPDILPGSSPVISLAETRDGTIWMGTVGAGLFSLGPGGPVKVGKELPDRQINCLLPTQNNELWVGTNTGLYRRSAAGFTRFNLPPSLGTVQVLTMLQDRDANLWVGTDQGLLRVNTSGIAFSDDGKPSTRGAVLALHEDREGNLWVGSARGLERIRDSAFMSYSSTAGLPSERNGPIYIDPLNRTWVGSVEGGLFLLNNGRAEPVRGAGLEKDVIYSITGQQNEVWVGRQRGGLTRLKYQDGSMSSQNYTTKDGLSQNSVYAVYETRNHTVWAGTLSGGISRFTNSGFTTYTKTDGLPSNSVSSILETSDGAIWVATPQGLAAFANGRWQTYTSRDGLPSDNVNCLFEDSSGTLWVGTSAGLVFFVSGSVQQLHDTSDLFRGQIFGLAEDMTGWLWIASSNHIFRVRRDELSGSAPKAIDVRQYDVADGLHSVQGMNRSRSVAVDAVGRIWFSTMRGLSVVDPAHLNIEAPAIAHVEGISVDGIPIGVADTVRIPSSHKRITLSYTGLSLAVPERVRFRYFLTGFDKVWSKPVASREAVYTNLAPGLYQFRVIASNDDGLWNKEGASIAFAIAPAWYQTVAFRISCLLAALLLLWLIYYLRMKQAARSIRARFDERIAERTRLARDLHDTLLQTLQGNKLVAEDALENHSDAEHMRHALETLSGWIDRAMREGRAALNALHSSTFDNRNLSERFQSALDERELNGLSEKFLTISGTPVEMDPITTDEICRVGYEAIRNAFMHSCASRIEVQLTYSEDFTLIVRDNGRGMDSTMASRGRDGHFGLQSMRERAERIRGRFQLITAPNLGTTIELKIAGKTAFGGDRRGWSKLPSWLGRNPTLGSVTARMRQW
jgi:ligand-binding sensor domain-containing protein/signal transduction histidine kinase